MEEAEELDKGNADYAAEYDDEDYDDEGHGCEGCGLTEHEDGYGECPFCCSACGSYAPGSEQCDWCRSSDECAKFAARQYKKEARKNRATEQSTPVKWDKSGMSSGYGISI